MKNTIRKLAVPGLLALGLGGGLTLADVARDPITDVAAQQTAVAAPSPQALSSAFRAASSNALPGVVFIQVEVAGRTVSQQVPPELRGTPFEDMFGGRGRVPPSAGSGSGFILTADGYVVTNNHVVENASRVKVVMNDRREYDARVVGRDPNTDIAVLKIEAKNLPTVRIGDSDALETGDWVLALGYPLQLGQTTTAGIVSAKGRSLGIMARSAGATAPLEHFIQTDAAINPGNSGGPLVDLQGRVVGVNSAIASPTGYYSGYGFAVPINLAKRVVDDLIRFGVVHRPMLGVEIRDAGAADAEVFRLAAPSGAVVASEPRGAAHAAGLRLGDVIVAIDGQPIRNTGDLMEAVMRKAPGDRVAVDYVRYGDSRRATIRLAEMDRRPTGEAGRAPAEESGDDAQGRVGFSVTQLTPDIARQIRSQSSEGVVVNGVDPVGPAAGQLYPGLVVERLNGREVRTVAELRQAVSAVNPGQVVSILARRPDGSQTIVNFRARS
ncbi:MAG TPA: trypsin-like peptidase domain-containing protein [Longimicrobiaceae bacterium]|nr:trypsin-like peptidase domain-containing protein [Longimicrobiaceae bacterium]